uniref:Low density lipoprotein-related protein 12 n=1 Tax=Mus musculus TaxID=10090 RepID=A0A2I3BQR2_MOUSE
MARRWSTKESQRRGSAWLLLFLAGVYVFRILISRGPEDALWTG